MTSTRQQMDQPDAHAPLLIALPHGLNASGVTLWALRLVNALSRTGRACGLIVHNEPPGQNAIDVTIDEQVEVFDARSLPSVDACNSDLEMLLPVYRHALGVMLLRQGGTGPVVISPNLLADCYRLCVALGQEKPGLVRTLAVHHSDIAYNDLLCTHYAQGIDAFVGVSTRIAGRLGGLLPGRGEDIAEIPYGVEVPDRLIRRDSLAHRAIRLVYVGRLEHEQKRIGSMVTLHDALVNAGVDVELALVGDGPAREAMEQASASRPGLMVAGAMGPSDIAQLLDRADCFVLGSRYEGLSVSLLESMAHGCVPIVTPCASGTDQVVVDGQSGFVANAQSSADATEAGQALAAAVVRAFECGDDALNAIRQQCHRLIARSYSVERCAQRYGALIDRLAMRPAHVWPAEESMSACDGGGKPGSITVPSFAAARLERMLGTLTGTSVAVYGAGVHTHELETVFERSTMKLTAVYDDDLGRAGQVVLGKEVMVPVQGCQEVVERLIEMGTTDVLISSWLHCQTMARGVFARTCHNAGLKVHVLYDAGECPFAQYDSMCSAVVQEDARAHNT